MNADRGQHSPSMSKSGLLLSPCLHWAEPGAPWYNEDLIPKTDTELRDNGTIWHRWIASESDPDIDVTTDQTKYMAMYQHASNWLDENVPCHTMPHHELVLGANWLTGEFKSFPDLKDRNYPNEPGWQYGTTDILWFDDTTLVVGDWKTGEGLDAGAEAQLLSLACAANAVFGPFRNVRTVCLKVNDCGVWPEWHDYTAAQLQNHADAMRFAWEDLDKPHHPRPGLHCTAQYCPRLAYCDAIKAYQLDQSDADGGMKEAPLIPVDSLLRKPADIPTTDDDAGYVMAVVAAARRQMKYTEQQVKDYLANGGKAVQGKYEWGPGGNGYRWRKG